MKIIFKKSTHLEEYHGSHEGGSIDFVDGEKKDIPDAKARELITDFKDNFEVVHKVEVKEIKKAPKDKMIKKARTKKL